MQTMVLHRHAQFDLQYADIKFYPKAILLLLNQMDNFTIGVIYKGFVAL